VWSLAASYLQQHSLVADSVGWQWRLLLPRPTATYLAAQLTHRCTTSTMGTSRNRATRRYYKAIHSKHFITGKRSDTVSAATICRVQQWTLQYAAQRDQVSCVTCINVAYTAVLREHNCIK